MGVLSLMALASAASYSQQRKAGKEAKRQAADQATRNAGAAEAARMAAQNASERERVAAQVEVDQAAATEQLDNVAEVTTATAGTSAPARRRRIQAEFNVGDGAGSSGSIRV